MSRTQFVLASAWLVFCLFLFVNAAGLWPLIPFVAIAGLTEIRDQLLRHQMRAELRRVLNGQRG